MYLLDETVLISKVDSEPNGVSHFEEAAGLYRKNAKPFIGQLVWLARPSHVNAQGLSAPAIRWDGLASQTIGQ